MSDKDKELSVFKIAIKALEYQYQKVTAPVYDDTYALYQALSGVITVSESPDIIIDSGVVGVEHITVPAQGRSDQDALQRAQNMSYKTMRKFGDIAISKDPIAAVNKLFDETVGIFSSTKIFQGCEYHNALQQLERVLSTHNVKEDVYRSKCGEIVYLLEVSGPIYGRLYTRHSDHYILKNESAPVICPQNIDVFNILTDSDKCRADYVLMINPWWQGGYYSVLNCRQPEKTPLYNCFEYIPLCRCRRKQDEGIIKCVDEVDVFSALLARNMCDMNQQNYVIDTAIYNEIPFWFAD